MASLFFFLWIIMQQLLSGANSATSWWSLIDIGSNVWSEFSSWKHSSHSHPRSYQQRLFLTYAFQSYHRPAEHVTYGERGFEFKNLCELFFSLEQNNDLKCPLTMVTSKIFPAKILNFKLFYNQDFSCKPLLLLRKIYSSLGLKRIYQLQPSFALVEWYFVFLRALKPLSLP